MTKTEATKYAAEMSGWDNVRIVRDEYIAGYWDSDDCYYVAATDPFSGEPVQFRSVDQVLAEYI